MVKLPKISNTIILTGAYLIILGSLFFAGTSAYQYCIQRPDFVKWSSPDETANYYFSKIFAETGELLGNNNQIGLESIIVQPRSIKSSFGVLKPVSFLGLPLLYGFLGRLLSTDVLPYLTPLFAVLGLWMFFGLVRRVFNRSTAIIATTMMSTFPVYWYFSSKSMFHNVLFIVAGLVSLYCGLRALERLRLARRRSIAGWLALVWLALAGLSFGWMVATRTSELLWLLPVILILVFFYFKEIGWYRWLWWGAWAWTAMLPVAIWNQILHGSWYGGGYPAMSQSINNLSQTSLSLLSFSSLTNGSFLLEKIVVLRRIIFHFGFWPRQSLVVFQRYVLEMFPWLLPLAVIGIIIFVVHRRQWSKEKWLFLLIWCLVSVFLVLYYGSWKFNDNPDPSRFTIGNSYTRYWLPIYLGALPWAADGLRRLIRFLFRRQVVRWVIIILVAIISFYSLRFSLVGSEEGLILTGRRHINDYKLWSEVMARTEIDSIIITRYHDKLFFPDRQVIVGLFDDNTMNQYYRNLMNRRPIYYFNFRFQPNDWHYLNDRRLPHFGYQLQEQWRYNEFSLYRLQPVEELAIDQ